MERHQFELIHEAEDSWWYRGRAAVVTAALARIPKVADALDFGAGFGAARALLSRFAERVYAFEPDTEASGALAARGYAGVEQSAEAALARRYGLIALLDVVEHIEDDAGFLRELHGALIPGGRIILTVPAYQWLWSPLDVHSRHYRRYTRRQLVGRLRAAGYRVEFASYWNTFLFPVAALVRLMGSAGRAVLLLPGRSIAYSSGSSGSRHTSCAGAPCPLGFLWWYLLLPPRRCRMLLK